MPIDAKIISRRELYDLVWSKPISKLAPEFGLSDRGLAKLCTRHRIPVPPRGYWAKLAAGANVEKTAFLELKDRSLDKVRIQSSIASLPDPVAKLAERQKKERKAQRKAVEDESPSETVAIDKPHKLIAATARYLRNRKPDSAGRLAANKEGQCGVVVHKDSVERAIYVLDALARALEDMGLPLEPKEEKMSVTRGADTISFTLVERTKRKSMSRLQRKSNAKSVERNVATAQFNVNLGTTLTLAIQNRGRTTSRSSPVNLYFK